MKENLAIGTGIVLLGLFCSPAQAAMEYTEDGVVPPHEEQVRWLINRARYAPELEGDRLLLTNSTPGGSPNFDVCEDLDGNNDFGTTEAQWQVWKNTRQPVAPNAKLTLAATTHCRDMAETKLFQHNSPSATYYPLNSTTRQRHTAVGYTNNLSGYFANIAAGSSGTVTAYPAEALSPSGCHQNLWVDTGIADRGHRKCILNANAREIGVGFWRAQALEILSGKTYRMTRDYYAEDFGLRTGWHFLTDTVWYDANRNGIYDQSEGVAGVQIRAYQNGVEGAWYDVSQTSGNFALPIQGFVDNQTVQIHLINTGSTAKTLTVAVGFLAQGEVTLPPGSTLVLGSHVQPATETNRSFRDLVPEFGFQLTAGANGIPSGRFNAYKGLRYQVESCTSLLLQDWVRIQDFTADESVELISCPAGQACGFMRVGMIRD